MLVRLLYASRSVDPIDRKLVDAILKRAHSYNPEHGITGILCAYENDNVFLQALEGGRDEVNQLYNSLVEDSRHTDVTLLAYNEIDERRFASWRMGRVDMSRINIATVLRYSSQPRLNPFELSGKTAMALLEDLSNTAAVISRTESS